MQARCLGNCGEMVLSYRFPSARGWEVAVYNCSRCDRKEYRREELDNPECLEGELCHNCAMGTYQVTQMYRDKGVNVVEHRCNMCGNEHTERGSEEVVMGDKQKRDAAA